MKLWIKIGKTSAALMEDKRKVAEVPIGKSGSSLRLDLTTLREILARYETVESVEISPEDPDVEPAVAAAPPVHAGSGSGHVVKPPVSWIPSPNFASRNGNDIDTLVLHNTDASLQSTIQEFQNPANQKSAHYIVGRDGGIVQMVRDESTAWHSGNKPVNQRSIGIEIVASKAVPGITSAQEASLIQLCRYVMDAYGVTRADVKPHRAIKPTECPGWVWKTDAELTSWKSANLP
jgi:hypothetical protein